MDTGAFYGVKMLKDIEIVRIISLRTMIVRESDQYPQNQLKYSPEDT